MELSNLPSWNNPLNEEMIPQIVIVGTPRSGRKSLAQMLVTYPIPTLPMEGDGRSASLQMTIIFQLRDDVSTSETVEILDSNGKVVCSRRDILEKQQANEVFHSIIRECTSQLNGDSGRLLEMKLVIRLRAPSNPIVDVILFPSVPFYFRLDNKPVLVSLVTRHISKNAHRSFYLFTCDARKRFNTISTPLLITPQVSTSLCASHSIV